MDPERWRRVEEIYYGALEREPARRNEYVDHACGGDAALRDEVGRLLDDEAEAESFIESPAGEVAARALIGGTPDVPVATAGKPSGEEVPVPLTAYAALRRRLSDIRLMIRQWVQYAAARGALPSLVPLVAIVFAVDLLLHRSQPLGEILEQRGLLYGALVAAGILLHWNRRKWPAAPDRRFFREHYGAQHVLRAVIDEIRAAQSLAKVAPRVVLQIESALHPESAAVLVRRAAGALVAPLTALRVVAAVGAAVAIGRWLPDFGLDGHALRALTVAYAGLVALLYTGLLLFTRELGPADLALVRRVLKRSG